MENDFNNGKIPEFDDVSFRPDLENGNQSSDVGAKTSGGAGKQTSVRSSKVPLLALLLIAVLAVLTMFVALIYDWGVNRDGFNDIAALFGSEEKIAVKGREIIIEKDLPEYNEYMDTAGSHATDDDIVFEEQTINEDKTDVADNPGTTVRTPDLQKPKTQKPATPKQTQVSKVDLEDIPYPDNVNNRIQKSPVKEGEWLFTVQVYATPSKDDAEAWKEKLINQNIDDVNITSQRIKNRDWFRVRFGTFKSVDEARQAASKSGFAHSWIDRVK